MLEWKLARPQMYQTLTFYPLVDSEPRQLPFRLLKDALDDGTVVIGEIGGGSVPELQVENRSDSAVLILDGEQLIGAKQNRMTNRTILLAPHTATAIPVSCMEQGRWHLQSRQFRHGDHYSPAKLRRVARRTEAAYTAARMAASPGVLREAQGPVWSEISDYADKLGGRSKTGALNDLYGFRSSDLREWSKHFPWVDDQVGILVFLADRPLGMDVVGCHRLYARLHKRLVSGYVMDALAARDRSGKRPNEKSATGFLDKVRSAERTDAPTVGRGRYRVLSGSVTGGELQDTLGLVHLSAFPDGTDADDAEPPLPRAHHRRRWRPEAD